MTNFLESKNRDLYFVLEHSLDKCHIPKISVYISLKYNY